MSDTKIITRFEMTRPDELVEARPVEGVYLAEVTDPAGTDLERIRRLHDDIAAPHRWSSLSWSPERWQRWLEASDLHHWSIQRHGTDIGWGCLRQHTDGEVELDSFGLLPATIGNGYGGHALTLLTRQAWARMAVPSGPGLLWLTTTNWDHPHAAANYRARGFRATTTRSATL